MRVFTDEWRLDDGLIRIWYDTHNAESEHKHEFLEIVLVIEGSVIHRVDNDI